MDPKFFLDPVQLEGSLSSFFEALKSDKVLGKLQLNKEFDSSAAQLVVLVVLVTGVKKSQLLDSSLDLGLEFDKNIFGACMLLF